MYDWGSYDQKLYESYKDNNSAALAEFKASLEEQIASAKSSGRKLPPGIYAELGTLYLQEGDTAKAIGMYKLERDVWPESKGLMDAMITNLERSQADKRAVGTGASL
jgi:hypothetical protein